MHPYPELKKFSVLIISGPKILTVDGIEHAGKLWIVPKWRNHTDGTISPELMIRFDILDYQNRSLGLREYTVNVPIPPDALAGLSTLGFETITGNDAPLYAQEKKTIH